LEKLKKVIQLNILIIAETINFQDGSGAKGRVALIKNLKKAGYNLKVLHYSRKEIYLKGINCISIKEDRMSILFLLSRLERLVRFYFKIHLSKQLENKFGFSFTLFNDRNSIAKALFKEDDFKPDWVFTLSQGGSFRPHHALLKTPKYHSKWIAYIHDPYPMHWYPKPYTWKESGFENKEAFMKKVADKCTVTAFPSQLLMEWMGNKFAPFYNKGIVIPHQIDSSIGALELKGNFNLEKNKFTVLHAGNLLQARNPRALVEGFIKFKEKLPLANTQLILLGPAPFVKTFLEEQSALYSFIQIIPENKPFNEVLALQHKVDVNIILEAKAEFSPFLPGKFPHCIQAEKPILILGPIKSEVRRLLGAKYPYWSPRDDSQRIASTIQQLYNNWLEGNKHLIREDLKKYLSERYLKEVIDSLPRTT